MPLTYQIKDVNYSSSFWYSLHSLHARKRYSETLDRVMGLYVGIPTSTLLRDTYIPMYASNKYATYT